MNRRINFGHLVLGQILLNMGSRDDRDLALTDVLCNFPRFLQIIMDGVLTDAEKDERADSNTQECIWIKKNGISMIINKNPYPEVPTVLTNYLRTDWVNWND